MSMLGVNGALAGAHCNVDKTQKTSTGNGVSFAELAAAKAKHQGWGVTENSSLVNYYASTHCSLKEFTDYYESELQAAKKKRREEYARTYYKGAWRL